MDYFFKKDFTFKEKINFVFLCGSHFNKYDKTDKRSILKDKLKLSKQGYYPIILEENFCLKESTNKYLGYDDIFLNDLSDIEKLVSIFASKIFIIHDSYSTSAELGVFASNKNTRNKIAVLCAEELSIDEETAPYITQIYNAYDSGMTMKEIAEDLNNKGVSNVRGGRFSINIISKILSNRRYIGEYRFRDIVVPDGIPAIIDKDLFDRVQESLEKNKHASAKYKADDEYILTTKLYCGKCKSFMVGESGTNHQGLTYRYYKCIDAKRKRGCDKKAVKKDYIEDVVLNVVVAALTNGDYISSLIDSLLEFQESENTDLKILQQQLSKTNKKIDNMLNAIEQGIITDSTKQRLQELEIKKKDIEIQIAQEEISKPKYTREQYQQFFNNAKVADMKDQVQRKALINYFVNAVVLYDDYALFYLNYKEHALKLKLSDIEKSSDTILNALPQAWNLDVPSLFSL